MPIFPRILNSRIFMTIFARILNLISRVAKLQVHPGELQVHPGVVTAITNDSSTYEQEYLGPLEKRCGRVFAPSTSTLRQKSRWPNLD